MRTARDARRQKDSANAGARANTISARRSFPRGIGCETGVSQLAEGGPISADADSSPCEPPKLTVVMAPKRVPDLLATAGALRKSDT